MIASALTGPLLLALVGAEQTPSPSPSPDETMTIYTVTPGILGFITFFVLAFIGWLLFRSLTRHVRGIDRRRREELAAEESAAQDAEDAGGSAR